MLSFTNNGTRVALTGFMGVGKSSVARHLSQMLHCERVDLDSFIEEREQRKHHVPEEREVAGRNRLVEQDSEAVRKQEIQRDLGENAQHDPEAAEGLGTQQRAESLHERHSRGCRGPRLDHRRCQRLGARMRPRHSRSVGDAVLSAPAVMRNATAEA